MDWLKKGGVETLGACQYFSIVLERIGEPEFFSKSCPYLMLDWRFVLWRLLLFVKFETMWFVGHPFCRNNIALFSCEITACWKFVTSITAPLFQWSVSDIVSPWSTSSPDKCFGMWAIGWLLFHESWRCKFYLNHFLCMLALFCLALFCLLLYCSALIFPVLICPVLFWPVCST